ncbi:hypothetical protein BC829DRAFT_186597 [Chytridium lagenaria]|nr:hypothetical protein BC829DRAFT_186597 [Chytridium lagenaria]
MDMDAEVPVPKIHKKRENKKLENPKLCQVKGREFKISAIRKAFRDQFTNGTLTSKRNIELKVYTRIPNPIPKSWARQIKPLSDLVCVKEKKGVVLTLDILKELEKVQERFIGVYMDPPWALDKNKIGSGQITVEEFGLLDVPHLIPHGFLFIWVDKTITPKIVKIVENWGFRYVDNFAWIKWDLSHKIAKQKSTYFSQSKATCLIFSKNSPTL